MNLPTPPTPSRPDQSGSRQVTRPRNEEGMDPEEYIEAMLSTVERIV